MRNQIKFEWVVVGCILLVSLFLTFRREKEISNIEKDKGITIATITDCSSTVHDPFNIKIEYKYKINEDIYYSSESSFNRELSKCVETRNCIGKRYALYYNKSNPKESKINFDDEE